MSSFFAVGDRYRDRYVIESVETFLDGELAVARTDENERYYLQWTKLKKGTQSRVIQQYRSLNHPLVLPFAEVYTEERSIVFIRPYIELTRLDERLKTRPWNEEETVRLTRDLLHLEKMLNSLPLPMYLLLDPRNMGLTGEGNLKVFFCGVRNYTALEPVIDWGTWMYMCMTGQIPGKSLSKLPSDHPFSGPMVRLIEKSLKNASVERVLSQIETYEKRKNSPGLLGRLFGVNNRPKKEKREEGLRLPPIGSSRPQPSAKGKVKPLFGEKAETKMPSEAAEGLTLTPTDDKGLSPSKGLAHFAGNRGSITPDKRPDMQRRAEEPKAPFPVEESGQTEREELKQAGSPHAETIKTEVTQPDKEVPGTEASAPAAEVGRETALSRDWTEKAQKEDASREIQGSDLESASGKEEEIQRLPGRSPTGRGKTSGALSRPLAENGLLSPDKSLLKAPSDNQILEKRERNPMDRMTLERLRRERKDHDRLAGQFREYAKSIQSGGGNR